MPGLTLSAALLWFARVGAQHMIYEPHPEGHQIREPGAYGQDCTPQSGDYPDKCPKVGMTKTSNVDGDIVCAHNFDCCLCGEMVCGTDPIKDPCGSIICNGDSGCFGVKNIKMIGDPEIGASLNCNGDLSCMGTYVDGINVGELYCTGDGSCAYSKFNIECVIAHGEGCPLLCVGDNACEGDPSDPRKVGHYVVKNSHGMACSHDSCRQATYIMTTNVGGDVSCTGEESCNEADITINNILGIFCGGVLACLNANMLVMNPQNHFAIMCTGPKGCYGTTVEIMVTDPSVTFIESISCISAKGCWGASFTIYKQGASAANPLEIGELSCGAAGACVGAVFDLGPFVTVTECRCAPNACGGLLGVSACPTQGAFAPPPIATKDPAPINPITHGGGGH